MWMACHTQEEIAGSVGEERSTISKIADDFMQTVLENQTHKAAASHATDFDPPQLA
ncbi:MAG: hypothetical protein WBE85_11275 [Methylocella sp.]